MSFSVKNNADVTSLFLQLNSQKLNSSLTNLSTGLKLNKSADDAAAMAIANNYGAQVREASQSIMNINDSIGMMQIADGALSSMGENMDRIRELTLRASSATMNDANRSTIQNEINHLMQSNQEIATTTSYNGISLLDGSQNSLADASSVLNLEFDVSAKDPLEVSLETIDTARNSLGGIRSDLGSTQNQLLAELKNTQVFKTNIAAAESNLRDVDYAQESMNFNQQSLQLQAGIFAKSQANVVAKNVMSLLGT